VEDDIPAVITGNEIGIGVVAVIWVVIRVTLSGATWCTPISSLSLRTLRCGQRPQARVRSVPSNFQAAGADPALTTSRALFLARR
jgi:hypothetical protein